MLFLISFAFPEKNTKLPSELSHEKSSCIHEHLVDSTLAIKNMKLILPVLLLLLITPVWAQKPGDYSAVTQEMTGQVMSVSVASPPLHLAVVPFTASRGSEQSSSSFGAYLTETIIGNLSGNTSRIKLFERTRLDAVLKEQEFILTDLLTPSAALKIGQLVPIDALLSGTYTKLKSYVDVSGRLIDVATGEILLSYNGRIRIRKNLATLFRDDNVQNKNTSYNSTNSTSQLASNSTGSGNAARRTTRVEACAEQSQVFRKRLRYLSTNETADKFVGDAIKVPFQNDCGDFHFDIIRDFTRYKISNESYDRFLLGTLDTLTKPSMDERAIEIVQFIAGNGVSDLEWHAGLRALSKSHGEWTSTYLQALVGRPSRDNMPAATQRTDEYFNLLARGQVGWPEPLIFERGLLSALKGANGYPRLGRYIYSKYGLNAAITKKRHEVFETLNELYKNEDSTPEKTEVLSWIARFLQQYKYPEAAEDLYALALRFSRASAAPEGAADKLKYPASDLQLLIQECQEQFRLYAVDTENPRSRDERINFCVRNGIAIPGVVPTAAEVSQILRGQDMAAIVKVMKLVDIMPVPPQELTNDFLNLLERRGLTSADQLNLDQAKQIALRQLSRLNNNDPKFISALVKNLEMYREGETDAALIRIGKPAVGLLTRRLEATSAGDGHLQNRIIVILGKIGKDAAAAIPAIRKIVKQNSSVAETAEAAIDLIR